MENLLVLVNSLAADANVSADGSGNATVKTLLPTVTGPVTNGTTAGTVTIWSPIYGASLKVVLIRFAGYNNTTATRQSFTFPSTFTNFGFFWVGGVTNPNTSGVYFLNGASVIATNNCHGSTFNLGSTARIVCESHGEFTGNCTGFQADGSLVGTSDGSMIVIGV